MVTSPSTAARVRIAIVFPLLFTSKISNLLSRVWVPGVSKAVANVNDVIAPAFIKANIDLKDQKAVDKFMLDLDGTKNKGLYWVGDRMEHENKMADP